jgi:hypothetical protein
MHDRIPGPKRIKLKTTQKLKHGKIFQKIEQINTAYSSLRTPRGSEAGSVVNHNIARNGQKRKKEAIQ